MPAARKKGVAAASRDSRPDAAVQPASDTSSSSAGPSKWTQIRPDRPPASIAESAASASTDLDETAGPSSERRRPLHDEGRLKLEVLDVSSTAVALAIFTAGHSDNDDDEDDEDLEEAELSRSHSTARLPSSDALSRLAAGRTDDDDLALPGTAPAISIRLNSAPWPHVLHSDSAFSDLSDRREGRDTGATIVVFGLEPGKDYEVELDVVDRPFAAEGSPCRPFMLPTTVVNCSS